MIKKFSINKPEQVAVQKLRADQEALNKLSVDVGAALRQRLDLPPDCNLNIDADRGILEVTLPDERPKPRPVPVEESPVARD